MGFLDAIPLIGSVFGGLTNLIGGDSANKTALQNTAMTNAMNLKINRENQAFQDAMLNKQMDYNLDMFMRQNQVNLDQWYRQNEYNEEMYNKYNSPQARAHQYREAGINPVLAVSGMSGSFGSVASQAGNMASPLGATAGGGYSPIGMQAPQTFMDNKSGFWSSILDALAQLDVRKSQADRNREEVKGMQIDNMTRYAANIAKLNNIKADTNNRKVKTSVDQIEYDLRRATFDSSVSKARFDSLNTAAQNGVIVAQANLMKSETALNEAKLQWLPEQMRTQLANMNAQTMVLAAQRKLTYEQALTEATKRTLNLANASLSSEKASTEKRMRMSEEQARRYNESLVSEQEYKSIQTANNSGPNNPYQVGFDGVNALLDEFSKGFDWLDRKGNSLGKRIGLIK